MGLAFSTVYCIYKYPPMLFMKPYINVQCKKQPVNIAFGSLRSSIVLQYDQQIKLLGISPYVSVWQVFVTIVGFGRATRPCGARIRILDSLTLRTSHYPLQLRLSSLSETQKKTAKNLSWGKNP
jgi:hypothetical protein